MALKLKLFDFKIKFSHLKKSGQVSSAILPTSKVIKKNIWKKFKRIFVIKKGMAPLWLQKEEIIAQKVQGFPVLYDERVKGNYKWDMVQSVSEIVFFFVENSNFFRGSTEASVCGCSEYKFK